MFLSTVNKYFTFSAKIDGVNQI